MAELLWSSAEIAAATGGRTQGAPFDVYGLSFDSRSVAPGELFIALAGERDGHEFIPAALSRGASGVLASQDVKGPAVLVDDTLRALERLGEAARDRAIHAKRAAVTGSVGKTSVTQAIAAGLRIAGKAHSSIESFNNHIGVPLTLARMPRDTERAVFEIGMNHADEIAPLSCMVRPDVAVVTTVGAVHVENFPDGEAGVAKAKAEIIEGMAPGGVAILPAEDKWFDLLSDAAKAKGLTIRTFGRSEGCDARLIDFTPGSGEAHIRIELDGKPLSFNLRHVGGHWGLMAPAVVLAVQALGAPVQAAIEGFRHFDPLPGRGADHALGLPGGGSFTLIDESYNANPISMRAALRTLGEQQDAGRRIAVLSDMLELGADADEAHAALAEPIAAAGVDQVFTAGPLMRSLDRALPPGLRGGWAETAAALSPMVLDAVRPGDVVMAKGSKGSKASLVVQDLMRRSEDLAAKGEGGVR